LEVERRIARKRSELPALVVDVDDGPAEVPGRADEETLCDRIGASAIDGRLFLSATCDEANNRKKK
jgi:hypothetical protein